MTFLERLRLTPMASVREEYLSTIPQLLRGDEIKTARSSNPQFILNVGAIEWIVRATMETTGLPLIPPKEALSDLQAFLDGWRKRPPADIQGLDFFTFHFYAAICVRNTRRQPDIHKAALTNIGLAFMRGLDHSSMWKALSQIVMDPSAIRRITEQNVNIINKAYEAQRKAARQQVNQSESTNS
jgi:hypothetical protein